MEKNNEYSGNPYGDAFFEELLPRPSMFLVDNRPVADLNITYRSRDNKIERAYIKRLQANQWKPEFKVCIEGDYWGSLNGKLFDDVPALVHALRKRGLTQVEF